MNFLEELKNLDINDIGRWPMPVQAFFMLLVFLIATAGAFWFFVWENQMPRLEKAQAEERQLKTSFESKQKKAANFTAYKAQLTEIERSFGTMLRQLPGKTEIPNLLVDISQTGLGAGLQEELFQPTDEIRKDFYAEKPIKIRLSGSYHEFGKFVSDIAALPRIVTLHDIEAVPKGSDAGFDELVLNLTAKTYRYLDEEELAAVAAEDEAKSGRGKKGKARTTRETSKGNRKPPAGKKG
ncbi:MAG: type 4a pilus biogenesis protein PilO [Gammaproteobacteria bacterium]|nr:type 4a pilus biogenesis protein PilO [Gammaproteobacteria bacterium]MDH5275671.1 type 4a pilus biogenesis protein PilO [Gammaproteobacteria bacterium]